jgi:hypothetical protein
MTCRMRLSSIGSGGRSRVRNATLIMGSRDGEVEYEASSVDEGRCADAESARARENKNECHRAEAEAD